MFWLLELKLFQKAYKMLIILMLLSILHVQPTSALITDVTLFSDEVNVTFPNRLLIPCHFDTNTPINDEKIIVEWGMTPETGGSYTPVVHLFDTIMLPAENPEIKGQLFVQLLPKGNCSLVIHPTGIEYSGIYEIHLKIDGAEYKPTPKIKVNVFSNDIGLDVEESPSGVDAAQDIDVEESTSGVDTAQDIDVEESTSGINSAQDTDVEKSTSGVDTAQDIDVEESTSGVDGAQDIDDDIMQYGRAIQRMKKSGKLIYYEVMVGILAFFMVVGTISGCIFGVLYYRLRKKSKARKNDIESGMMMEENEEDWETENSEE